MQNELVSKRVLLISTDSKGWSTECSVTMKAGIGAGCLIFSYIRLVGYSTSCSLCIASLEHGWKEVLAQKREKTSCFQGWRDHGIHLSKLLEKDASRGIIPLWDHREVLMVLQRPLLIPPIQTSSHTKYILLRIYRHTSVKTMYFLSAMKTSWSQRQC